MLLSYAPYCQTMMRWGFLIVVIVNMNWVFVIQARQAYLIGNKALAKELSAKGHVYNVQMKAAHSKAQESIYRQRFVTFVSILSFYVFFRN